MDYFSLSKVKQSVFKQEKKKKRERYIRSWVKKFLFFMGL